MYCNDPKFSDRQVWANCRSNYPWRSSLIRVYTVCHSICIFWTHYSMVKPLCSNFKVITANHSGVRNFGFLQYGTFKLPIPIWFPMWPFPVPVFPIISITVSTSVLRVPAPTGVLSLEPFLTGVVFPFLTGVIFLLGFLLLIWFCLFFWFVGSSAEFFLFWFI